MTETYNPFVQIAKSFEGFAHSNVYYKLRRQSTGSKILCALIVTLLLNLITFGISAAKLAGDKDIEAFINDMPDFTYSNATFSLEKRYETTTSDTYVLIDTDVSYYYNGTDDGGYINPVNVAPLLQNVTSKNNITQAMFISESNIVIINLTTNQVQQMKFSELSAVLHIPDFSKASIQTGYKGFIIKWAVILGLIWIPFRFAGLFLAGLFYCILAQIVKSLAKSTDDFNTIYWISFFISIAFSIIKTLIKNTLPLGGGMLNTLFFALFLILIVKTLKEGNPEFTQGGNGNLGTATTGSYGASSGSFGTSINDSYGSNMDGSYETVTSNSYGSNTTGSYETTTSDSYGSNMDGSYETATSDSYGSNTDGSYETTTSDTDGTSVNNNSNFSGLSLKKDD